MNTNTNIEQLVAVDGYLTDPETGEVLGLSDRDEGFQVTDEASAEWVLGLRLDAEANLARNEAKRRAVLANLDAMDRREKARIAWLDHRFGPGLEEFAKARLAAGNCKTLYMASGSLGFRTIKGGLRVSDPVGAVAWAKTHGFTNAVKTSEAFMVSLLTPEQKDAATVDAALTDGAPFRVDEDRDVFTVKSEVNL